MHLGELLSKKFIMAKADLNQNKILEAKKEPIDSHSERNNPELAIVKRITDEEIADLIRESLSPAATYPDLSSETFRCLPLEPLIRILIFTNTFRSHIRPNCFDSV